MLFFSLNKRTVCGPLLYGTAYGPIMMICSKSLTPLDSLNRRLVYSPNMSHVFSTIFNIQSFTLYILLSLKSLLRNGPKYISSRFAERPNGLGVKRF